MINFAIQIYCELKHIKNITIGTTFREVELEEGAKLTIN